MVFVDARTMQTTIEKDGRISLYGIQFDTDSSAIKPQSDRTLQEVASLMRQNPNWALRITGHTDDVAPADYNQRLSMARAQAVVDALQNKYGIAAQRLRADGKGLTQPVASNANEAGRAQNRRVELTKD